MTLKIAVHRVGKHIVAGAVAVLVADQIQQHELLRILHRQRAQKNLIEQSENRGVRADPQRQSEDRDRCKAGRLAEHPRAKA